MRDLIEKLAQLYSDENQAKRILLFARIKHGLIAFDPAAEINWVNIYTELAKHESLLIKLYREILVDYPEEKEFFTCYIEEIEQNNIHRRAEGSPRVEIDPEIFNIHSIYDEFAFLDRQNVRTALRTLLDKRIKKNTLLVEGKSGSGLTYIHLYIAEILYELGGFNLIQVGPDFGSPNGNNPYKTGEDLAYEISLKLGLDYQPASYKNAVSKYATFFTKLREFNSLESTANLTPVICLDGLYKILNPSINGFIGQLLHEANTSRKFYVILSLCEIDEMKYDWPGHLQGVSTIKIDSFANADVECFVEAIYSRYHALCDLGNDPESLRIKWMEKNAPRLKFEENILNVKEIGETCSQWYKKFSTTIEKQLNGA